MNKEVFNTKLEYVRKLSTDDVPKEILNKYPIGTQVIVKHHTAFWESGDLATIVGYDLFNNTMGGVIWIYNDTAIHPITPDEVDVIPIISENFDLLLAMSDFEVEYGNELKYPFMILFATGHKAISPELMGGNQDWGGFNPKDIGIHFARYLYYNCAAEFVYGLQEEMARLRSDPIGNEGYDYNEYCHNEL